MAGGFVVGNDGTISERSGQAILEQFRNCGDQ